MDGMLGLMLFAAPMYVVAEVPPQYAAITWIAAERHELEYAELGAILITVHGSAWDIDETSSRGAMGLFQVMPMWARHFEIPVESLEDPMTNADVAARIILYSQERHTECDDGHDW